MTGNASPRSTPRGDAVRGIVILLVVVLGLLVLFWDRAAGDAAAEADTPAGPSATASSPATPTTTSPPVRTEPRVPDLAGVRLDAAKDRLRSLERTTGVGVRYPSSHDLSPRDRSQWVDSNWTVVTSRPAAGQPLVDGTELHLFVLREAEWTWFAANPTMPAVPADVSVDELAGAGQVLDGMSELVEYRYAPGQGPGRASPTTSLSDRPVEGVADDPSLEPAAEREERDSLRSAPTYGTVTVGSLPAAGTALRVGRILTVTVRGEWAAPAPAPAPREDDVQVEPAYSGGAGDDDGNARGSGPSGYTGCRSYAPGGKTWTPIPC